VKQNIPYVNRSDVVEDEVAEFSVEASCLGWPPGFVPERVETNLGNQRPLILVQTDAHAFYYEQELGCVSLTVFND
jgi:hypothetical protein